MAVSNVVTLPRDSPKVESILVPTDGSALSMAAALKAVEFAQRLQASIVAFNSIPVYQYPVYVGGIPFEYPSEADYETQCRAVAERYLGLVTDAAAKQGVPVETRIEFNSNTAQAIVELAQREHCGMIFMGSHGRGGLSRAFLGSVALKTLTQAHVPVMVDHPTEEEIARAEELMRQNAIEP
ncbi:universal stress protein [Rhodoferax ferrireducens]|uniref:universal stress protein n=1 Tax=Rhodoferax ferrireducens TaxID=192843 RepID=UPI00298D8BF8|nr:universal stress protein [Rhodoferax ferrireducens]WPC68400.1 universal stress protein [Rhodoferax ferrireducens]